jgi:hypothetical protein
LTSLNGFLDLLEVAEQPDVVADLVGSSSNAGHGLSDDEVNLASAIQQISMLITKISFQLP